MANPTTCRHNVIVPGFEPAVNEAYVRCISCDTILTRNQLQGRRYEYDIDHNMWVHAKEER